MNIIEYYPLKKLNTFGVDAKARYFVDITDSNQLRELVSDKRFGKLPVFILGGGSNVLFTRDFQGFIIKIDIKDIEVVSDGDDIYVESGGGVIWHDLVKYCVEHNFGGIENLSLIPGTVGAAPIQNIGAYGVELKNVFHSLKAIHLKTGEQRIFDRKECQFGYRNSIFKNELKGQYAVITVTLKLSKQWKPELSYGSLKKTIQEMGYTPESVTIKAISEAVIKIRRSKLPDPSVIGNAGSFFKNPVVQIERYKKLQNQFRNIPGYPVGNDLVKVPAGWLIEQCGWKGKKIGNTGTYKNQALVIINNGRASGKEIYDFSEQIINSVKEKFHIQLEREVNVI